MPLVQGGPPEWVWERPSEQLRWEVLATRPTEGRADFELRVHCGLELMRLQSSPKTKSRNCNRCLTALRVSSHRFDGASSVNSLLCETRRKATV